MSAPKPVPSRATLNALRGVLLTTSCSVFLLAEERRRRLKIARGALENARKLHTIKTRQRSGTPNGNGWDVQLVHAADELSTSQGYHKPTTDARRRRRTSRKVKKLQVTDGKASASRPLKRAENAQSVNEQVDSRASRGRHKTSKQAANSVESLLPSSLLQSFYRSGDVTSRSHQIPTRLRPSEPRVSREKAKATAATRNTEASMTDKAAPTGLESRPGLSPALFLEHFWGSPLDSGGQVSLSDGSAGEPLNLESIDNPPNPSSPARAADLGGSETYCPPNLQRGTAWDSSLAQGPDKINAEPDIDEAQVSISHLHANEKGTTISPRVVLDVAQTDAERASPSYEKPSPARDDLADLEALISQNRDHKLKTSAERKAAIDLFKMASSVRSNDPKRLTRIGMQLLENTIVAKETQSSEDTLGIMLRLEGSSAYITSNLIDLLAADRLTLSQMSLLLNCISSEQCDSIWRDGRLILEVLEREREQAPFKDIKQRYNILRRAGLFRSVPVQLDIEVEIRQAMVSMAADVGSLGSLPEELETAFALQEPEGYRQASTQCERLVGAAVRGQWADVQENLLAVRKLATPMRNCLQVALTRVADIIASNAPAAIAEDFFRETATTHELKIRRVWAFSVLDQHCASQRTEAMLSWLEFCLGNGVTLDESLAVELLSRCHDHWYMKDNTLRMLWSSFQRVLPDLPLPCIHAWTKRTQILCSSSSDTSLDRNFERMKMAARKQDWGGVSRLYDNSRNRGYPFTRNAYYLAVAANLAQNNPNCEKIPAILNKALYDYDGALSPASIDLIVALKASKDPTQLLSKTIRQGVRIEAKVYKEAAGILLRQGQHERALEACELFTRNLGNGDPLHSDENFGYLVYLYVYLKRYDSLESILSRFVGETKYWRGTSRCINRLTWAMKHLARRTVDDPDGRHGRLLLLLDEAYVHAKAGQLRPWTRVELVGRLSTIVQDHFGLADESPDDQGQLNERGSTTGRNEVDDRPSSVSQGHVASESPSDKPEREQSASGSDPTRILETGRPGKLTSGKPSYGAPLRAKPRDVEGIGYEATRQVQPQLFLYHNDLRSVNSY